MAALRRACGVCCRRVCHACKYAQCALYYTANTQGHREQNYEAPTSTCTFGRNKFMYIQYVGMTHELDPTTAERA